LIKIKNILIKIFTNLICSIILFGLTYLVAFLISHFFNITLSTIMLSEGLIMIFIGALVSPGKNHSSINLKAAGQRNANLITYQDLEVARLEQHMERESSDFHKNYYRNNIQVLFKYNLIIIFTGVFIIFYTLNFLLK
jgi:hypothetical protein